MAHQRQRISSEDKRAYRVLVERFVYVNWYQEKIAEGGAPRLADETRKRFLASQRNSFKEAVLGVHEVVGETAAFVLLNERMPVHLRTRNVVGVPVRFP